MIENLLLSLAGCASVQVAQPTTTEVVEDAGPGAHWTFDETRPPAESDGYRPPRKLAVLLHRLWVTQEKYEPLRGVVGWGWRRRSA